MNIAGIEQDDFNLTDMPKQELKRFSRVYNADSDDVMTREQVRTSILRPYMVQVDYAVLMR
jgi:hypothetical protein